MQEYNMPYNAREFSSPDPLNDSPTFSSPTKRRYTAKPRNSFPLQESSPTKQVFELDVGDKISSQKIKVTVEAEHSEKENSNDRFKSNTAQSSRRAPVTRRNERTITTTVPVKGLSESEEDTPAGTPKRGRGRPRKSISSQGRSRSRTRAATPGAKPACRGRKTLGSLVDGDDKNDWDFAIRTSDEISRRKGRSRSKKGATLNKVTSNAGDPSLSVKEASGAKSRGRRKTLGPEEVLIFEDNSGNTLPVENSDIGQNKQDKDVIAQTEASNMPVPSAFSTIRSTTTIRDDKPDILLATFDQAKPTPAKAGWSSPNVVQDFGSDFHNTRPDTPSLPLTMPHGIKSQLDGKQDAQRDYIESGDKVEDSVRELREFDTILESEGFSMISVDSVPSLREHFSSPLDARHTNEGNISVERTGTSEVVTPNVGVSKPKMLYSKLESAAGKETPFSSVPSRVLEAATPKINLKDTKSLSLGLSGREMTGVSLTASKPEVRKSSTVSKGMENKPLSALVNHMRINDDSFSSIPSAILEAATPARRLGEGFTLLNGRSQTERSSTAHAPLLKIPTEAMAGSTNQTSSSSRLLTPEDTPSPSEASPPHGKDSLSEKDAGELSEIGMEPFEGSSIVDSYVKSSPPVIVPKRYTYTTHLRQQHIFHPEITETPSIVFSSPALPPPMKRVSPRQEQGSREVTCAPSRPVLSPIVRAGRALQDIDLPAAPRANTQNIHRPFQSTSSQDLSSGTSCKTQCLEEKRRANNKLAESRRKGVKDDITGGDDTGEGLQKSFMIDEGLSHNRSTNSQLTKCCDGASQDDSISLSQRNISTAESDGELGNNSEPPSQNLTLYSESHEMANKEDSVIIDSAMSCHLEEEDIWQVEARHSSSVNQSGRRRVEPREKLVKRPRRSKIPSPWRKNSKRLVYSDELAKSSTSPSFESKAAISKAVSKSSEGPVRLSSVIQTGSGDEDILEPSIVWNLPQKSNFSPKPQAPSQLNLSALLATSPTKEPSQGLLEASAQDMSLPGKNLMATQLKNKPQIEANLVASSSVIEQVKNGESLTPKSSEHEDSVDYFADSIEEHETESGSSLDESQMGLENSIQSLTLSTSRLSSPPAESYLRNFSIYAIISAAFNWTRNQKATNPPLTPSTPLLSTNSGLLSANSWSKAHWKLLDSFYQESKIEPSPRPKEAKARGKSEYLGMRIAQGGTILELQQWHLDIVARFMYDRRVAPGWDEGIVARRLFAIIVAEERRAKGEI